MSTTEPITWGSYSGWRATWPANRDRHSSVHRAGVPGTDGRRTDVAHDDRRRKPMRRYRHGRVGVVRPPRTAAQMTAKELHRLRRAGRHGTTPPTWAVTPSGGRLARMEREHLLRLAWDRVAGRRYRRRRADRRVLGS